MHGRQLATTFPQTHPVSTTCGLLPFQFLDELCGQISTRFSTHQKLAITHSPTTFMKDSRVAMDHVQALAVEYKDDLPPGHGLSSLDAELQHWSLLLQEIAPGALPSTPLETLEFTSGKLVPCIIQLLQLACTWPVTSCSAE